MEQSRASQVAEPTPIFTAYRRGYDPDQVDRYVREQQRRLDESQLRASEAERKLVAAVSQLRELQRRVGALEDQRRPGQTPQFDGVGEHIQRIFEEAREGAELLKSTAETELALLRERTTKEARAILASARTKAEQIDAETARRRVEQSERLEEERTHSATQLSYLHEQRKNAVSELLRIREVIDSTISDVSADLRPRAASGAPAEPAVGHSPLRSERPTADPMTGAGSDAPPTSVLARSAPRFSVDDFRQFVARDEGPSDTAHLVRRHRSTVAGTEPHRSRPTTTKMPAGGRTTPVFDYEEQ